MIFIKKHCTGPRIKAVADTRMQGDARRPRTAQAHSSPDPMITGSSAHVVSLDIVRRSRFWDDALASLYAMKPNLKLDDVDVMMTEEALMNLLGLVSLGNMKKSFPMNTYGFALDMSLINNTLVFQQRWRNSHTAPDLASPVLEHTDCYKAATVPVPGVEQSPTHCQLLRYSLGPLSLVVRTKLEGSVQEFPSTKEPSGPQKTRNVHGIDVITAGQGILTPMAFQISARSRATDDDREKRHNREKKRRRRWAPRLWISGQTKLGLVDFARPGQDADGSGLTVVDLGGRVRSFQTHNQDGLRRLPGFLKILRECVRAHGGQCVVVLMEKQRPVFIIESPGGARSPGNFTLRIHSSGPREAHMLSDWQMEHFWSRRKATKEHLRPQEKTVHGHARPQKSFIRRWAHWLGF